MKMYWAGATYMLMQLHHAPINHSISFVELLPVITVCSKLSIQVLTSSTAATALLEVVFPSICEMDWNGDDCESSWANHSTRD